VWALMLALVWVLWGIAWGLFMWIVNDFTGVYWLTIASFMIIVPWLAGMWAISFFYCQWLGWSLIGSVLIVLSSGVQIGMGATYPALFPATTAIAPNTAAQYLAYQWLAMAFAIPLFLFYLYVMALNIGVYVDNKDRDINTDRAKDETEAEYTATVGHLAKLDETARLSVVHSDALLSDLKSRHGRSKSGRPSYERLKTIRAQVEHSV